MKTSTPYTISPALQAQLDVLREAYAAKLDDKISQICSDWTAFLPLDAGAAKTELLEALHRSTHTLAGSGATFGFPAVSTAARRAETVLKSLVQDEKQTPITSAQIAEIESAFRDLRTSSRVQEEVESFTGPSDSTPDRDETRSVYLFSDDPQGAPSWASSIEAFGYELHFFHDPTALKAAWLEKVPAAVIADCRAEPMQCGQEGAMLSAVLNEMRREGEVNVPLIWTTHTSDLRVRLQSVRLGGSALFPQPVDVDSLLVKLDDLTAPSAPEPFRILIIDDEPSLGRLYSVVLRQAGMETLVVSDPMEVMAPLVDFRPDVILMDVFMPGCSGVELASVIRQQEAYIGIPIMFLSVETDVSRQLAAMRHGGDDFLIKPVQPLHLVSAVTTRATRARALRNLMVRDSLTGLLNHTKTKEQLGIELDRAKRLGHTISLAMLDIDNFKVVNDTYGHATGDRVLRSLSRMLGQRLRQTDVVGRYGGEEFAVIMNGSNADDARKKLESVRVSFSHLSHFSDGREFRVTFSAGIASSPPWSDSTQLSEAADRALYDAKRAGRNQIALSDDTSALISRNPL
ncbi:diguanylate cyclase [bacterium]|nr:MAG: diguanylate cyclase [bacterium]